MNNKTAFLFFEIILKLFFGKAEEFTDHLYHNCHKLNVTELGKSELIIMSLLLIPVMVLPVHSQYDYPSAEDIAKMMPQEVSGTYSDHGVSVSFPNGWSGMITDFKDPSTGLSVTSMQVMEGGMMGNMEKLQKGEYEMIMLNIADITDYETLPEPESPDPEMDAECDYISVEKTTFDGKKAMKLETECHGDDFSMKMLAYHFATDDKSVMYAYVTSPSSEFDKHLNTFENSLKTLSISNLVDIEYEIPDELKKTSGEEMESEQELTVESSSQIPDWVRGNAEWWAQGAIGDSDFVSGIQYLIKEGIMQIPETTQAENVEDSQEIPAWIKNNADWWAQGLITDDDFVKGIQYLVEQGIIQV